MTFGPVVSQFAFHVRFRGVPSGFRQNAQSAAGNGAAGWNRACAEGAREGRVVMRGLASVWPYITKKDPPRSVMRSWKPCDVGAIEFAASLGHGAQA